MRRNQRGAVLLISLIVIIVLLLFGGTLTTISMVDARATLDQGNLLRANQLAEAGMERSIHALREDFFDGSFWPSWADGDIHGNAWGPNEDAYELVPFSDTQLGAGYYTVTFMNVWEKDDQIWVRSIGNVRGTLVGIEASVRLLDLSVWNSAIFAGFGVIKDGGAVIRPGAGPVPAMEVVFQRNSSSVGVEVCPAGPVHLR